MFSRESHALSSSCSIDHVVVQFLWSFVTRGIRRGICVRVARRETVHHRQPHVSKHEAVLFLHLNKE